VEACDVHRLERGTVAVAVLGRPQLRRVGGKKLKQVGQLADALVGRREALPVVLRSYVTGKDELIPGPFGAAGRPDEEAFALESVNGVPNPSAELIKGERSAVLVLVGNPCDGLGVVFLAVMQDHVLAGFPVAVQLEKGLSPSSSYSSMVFRMSSREIAPLSMARA
jgi:hypothetical protein